MLVLKGITELSDNLLTSCLCCNCASLFPGPEDTKLPNSRAIRHRKAPQNDRGNYLDSEQLCSFNKFINETLAFSVTDLDRSS